MRERGGEGEGGGKGVRMAGSGSERVAVELCKGINGLDKVVLRGPRGSSAEVLLYNNSNDIRHLFLSFL